VPAIKPIFEDLRATFHQASLGKESNLTHSFIWIWIGKLELQVEFIAPLLIFLFIIVSIYSIRLINIKESIITAFFILSPPMMLAIERANMDLIMYLLLWTGGFFISRKAVNLNLVSVVPIYSAIVMKIYPIAALMTYFFYKKKRILITILILYTFMIAIWLSLYQREVLFLLKNAPHPIPTPIGDLGFGGEYLFLLLNIPYSNHVTIIFGVFSAVIARIYSKTIYIPPVSRYDFKCVLFVIGLSTLLICFLLNTNYDYRCIYFLMTLPFLMTFIKKNSPFTKQRKLGYGIIGAIIFILWNEIWVLIIKTVLVMQKMGFLHLKRFVNREVPLITVAPELFQSKWLYINFLVEHALTWVVMTLLMAIEIKMILEIHSGTKVSVEDK
jgi:hypothetical protein|tara:strand:+ start:14623 stop:15777 length:1155 start_codon:yes stop_codon:yes gene_type:complete